MGEPHTQPAPAAGKPRIEWIDAARGLGIFFVIAGHTRLPIFLVVYLYSFHIPIFFFLSGYVFSADRYQTWGQLLSKKAVSLLIPYAAFSLLSLVPFAFDTLRHPPPQPVAPWDIISGLLFLNGQILWDKPIWFLPCLFVVELGYYGLARLFGSKPFWIGLSLLGLALAGLYFRWDTPIRLPWGMDIALVAIGFYGLGNLAGRLPVSLPAGWKGATIAVLAFGANLGVAYAMRQDHTDMYKLHMEPRLLFYAGALLGILTWTIAARFWSRQTFWQYLGRNSLAIMVVQFFIFWFYQKIAHHFFHYIPENTDFSGYILVPLTVISLFPVIFILNRYFPFLLGKGNGRTAEKRVLRKKMKNEEKPFAEDSGPMIDDG